MPTDHRMVLGEIIGERVRRQRRYFKEKSIWTITATKRGTRQEGDSHFNNLKMGVKKPLRKRRTTTVPLISDATWELADQRAALGRKLTANQQECRTLAQRFQAALKEDRICRMRK